MLLVGMNPWIQSSIRTVAPERASHAARLVRRPGALRAGIATALVALMLLVGFGRPAETAAYKSESLVCTTIEAGFQYTFDKALAAKLVGDTKGFEYWNNIAQAAQGLWYDAGCGGGSSGGGWRATT
ncbi:MAG TPA: hypothetical protein VFP05_08760 [Thermomicrobiales bacterium]|nr:hypothetical protein [Thermomicrobiales bacterium]